MRLAMQLLATVAYCALTSFQVAGLRPGSHPILLSHNRSSALTTRCTDRSSSGCEGAERLGVPMPRCLPPRISGAAPRRRSSGRPSPNRTDRVTWLPLELSPLTGREPRNVAWAFENANAAICARKKVGDVMLLPTVIFMMILWPVLLPALV